MVAAAENAENSFKPKIHIDLYTLRRRRKLCIFRNEEKKVFSSSSTKSKILNAFSLLFWRFLVAKKLISFWLKGLQKKNSKTTFLFKSTSIEKDHGVGQERALWRSTIFSCFYKSLRLMEEKVNLTQQEFSSENISSWTNNGLHPCEKLQPILLEPWSFISVKTSFIYGLWSNMLRPSSKQNGLWHKLRGRESFPTMVPAHKITF